MAALESRTADAPLVPKPGKSINLKPHFVGYLNSPTNADKQPGFRFTVPKDGRYTFTLRSDAESRLYLGDQKVVQGNRNEAITNDGDILLKAGQHAIRVEYVNDFARAQLQVSWQRPGMEKKEIDQHSLWREP